MHAVLITVRSSVATDVLSGLLAEQVESVQATPGLVMKTWLHDGEMVAGFICSRHANLADEYLADELAAEFVEQLDYFDRDVRHFAVLDELSFATGTPRPLGV